MLVTFLLVPLATNGILPVVMTFILLLSVNKASLDLAILTVACWILSSLIYWILYSHIIPINSQIKISASNKLTFLTPVIWSFSTAYLLVSLVLRRKKWFPDNNVERITNRHGTNRTPSGKIEQMLSEFNTHPRKYLVYIIGTMGFLAGIGMQLSLLSVSTSLRMVDRKHWSFGQVVAFTIFAPPLFDYVYDVLEASMPKGFRTGRENPRFVEIYAS
ncbi:hypothetical protein BKA63DRAFT_422330 [Paraphoma chrysanthemicola]|nr:hypothetical protein BKA63DRAFT_422330 [Paraphoma chrysanthemicola]